MERGRGLLKLSFVIGTVADAIVAWFRPFARKGLLLITAVLLAISIMVEIVLYGDLLGGSGFAVGVALRLALIAKFCTSYFYAREAGDRRRSP